MPASRDDGNLAVEYSHAFPLIFLVGVVTGTSTRGFWARSDLSAQLDVVHQLRASRSWFYVESQAAAACDAVSFPAAGTRLDLPSSMFF